MKLLELYGLSEIDWSKFPTSKDPVNVADPNYKQKMAARKKALSQQTSSSKRPEAEYSRGAGIEWLRKNKPDASRAFDDALASIMQHRPNTNELRSGMWSFWPSAQYGMEATNDEWENSSEYRLLWDDTNDLWLVYELDTGELEDIEKFETYR